MNDAALFLIGLGLTVAATLSVVWYLRPHLSSILTDLCGTPERALFWCAFSHVTLVLIPLIFALGTRPESGTNATLVLALARQLEHALIGLVVSVVTLGAVLARFIPRGAATGALKAGRRSELNPACSR